MNLAKYKDQGQKLASYVGSRPYLYKPLIWMLNKLALVIGFVLIPLKLYKDWRSK